MMKILVCITHVPSTTSSIKFTDQNTKIDNKDLQFIIGPYDDYALARAVELKEELGGEVTVLNVGNSETEPSLRKALAIGADQAIRIDAFPQDAIFVAKQIADVAKENNYDLILTGRESIDFNGGQLHGMLGELLGIPSVSPVMKLDIKNDKGILVREIEGGKEHLEIAIPFVAGCQEPIAEWKIPNMRGIMSARSKPMEIRKPTEHMPKCQTVNFELPAQKGKTKLFDMDTLDELVQQLKNEVRII